MTHRFPLKEVAFQAGLSLATVDRVLHGRSGVRATTRARVADAIEELERQYGAAGLAGRAVSIDVVMEAPRRFSEAVRAAFEAELAALGPKQVSVRFHIGETMGAAQIVSVLRAIRRRGSHGVVLKAPEHSEIVKEAIALQGAGIPVLTFVTDLPEPARAGYVGMDNVKAGCAAAGLMGQMLGNAPGSVLVNLSSVRFAGEDAREAGFRAELAAHFPHVSIVRVSEGMGLQRSTRDVVAGALADHPDIRSVYSPGGGNRAVLDAFDEARRTCDVFAGHDLDRANRALLEARRLSFVIHHDLRRDAQMIARYLLHHHRMASEPVELRPSRFEIVTPQSL